MRNSTNYTPLILALVLIVGMLIFFNRRRRVPTRRPMDYQPSFRSRSEPSEEVIDGELID